MTDQEQYIQYLQERLDKTVTFIEELARGSNVVFEKHILPRLLKNIRKTLDRRIPQQCIECSDDMPLKFTAYDTIAALYPSRCIDEMVMTGNLSDIIYGIIDEEIQKLSEIEKDILYNGYITFYKEPEYDIETMHKDVYDAFCREIEKHSQTKKIQNVIDNWF